MTTQQTTINTPELRRLLAEATPGPWEAQQDGEHGMDGVVLDLHNDDCPGTICDVGYSNGWENAALIAAAREEMPPLSLVSLDSQGVILIYGRDESAIEAAVAAVMAANPDKCEEVKAKPKAAAWFVGQVMKSTGGKANPQTVNAILRRRLGLPEDG